MNNYKTLAGGVIAMIFAVSIVLFLPDALFEDSKVTKAKEVVRHYLKHPDSAKFKGPYKLIYVNTFDGSGKAMVICGRVKVINSLGQYLDFMVYGQELAWIVNLTKGQKYALSKCKSGGTEL